MPFLSKKLLSLSTLSTAFLAGASTGLAQIVFTDIDPDLYILYDTAIHSGGDVTYVGYDTLDLDGDGLGDIVFESRVFVPSSSYGPGFPKIYAEPLGSNAMMYDGDFAAGRCQEIGPSGAFFTGRHEISHGSYWGGGPFSPAADPQLGVRLSIGGNTHYGWVKLIFNWSTAIIQSYAVNMQPDSSILAGFSGMENSIVSARAWEDNYVIGSRLAASFDIEPNCPVDTFFDYFRVYFVREDGTSLPDTDSLTILPPERYMEIAATDFELGTVDESVNVLSDEGLPVVNGFYRAAVVGFPADGTMPTDSMLTYSDTFFVLDRTMPVTDLELNDLGNTGNVSDLRLKFKIPADESNIVEYRVFLKTASTSNLFAFNNQDYQVLIPTGSDFDFHLDSTLTSIFGTIEEGAPYRAMVVSYNPSIVSADSEDSNVAAFTIAPYPTEAPDGDDDAMW